jgi:hypothetical protein
MGRELRNLLVGLFGKRLNQLAGLSPQRRQLRQTSMQRSSEQAPLPFKPRKAEIGLQELSETPEQHWML